MYTYVYIYIYIYIYICIHPSSKQCGVVLGWDVGSRRPSVTTFDPLNPSRFTMIDSPLNPRPNVSVISEL